MPMSLFVDDEVWAKNKLKFEGQAQRRKKKEGKRESLILPVQECPTLAPYAVRSRGDGMRCT